MLRRRGTGLGVIFLCVLAFAPAALASSASGPDPAVAEFAGWPFEVSCESGANPFNPLVAFATATGAELGSTPAELALAQFLENGPLISEGISKHDWRLISETDDFARFSHGRVAGSLEWVVFGKQAGGWEFEGYSSDCDPEPVIGKGTVVTWSLARKQRSLTPSSRTIRVDLGPGECASGAPQNPRAHFYFRVLGRKLLMISWLDPISRGGTCIEPIEPARKVRLPFPLGEYRLYDGSSFPPVRAGLTRSRNF
jgi:hypothetical protein